MSHIVRHPDDFGTMMTTMQGTSVSLQTLIDLRYEALQEALTTSRKFTLSGQRLTNVRGRGIQFDATREYQIGDDIRHMAWRVTARSLKPHVKIYCEEKERSVWLSIDLSPSLYFGTRSMFKSVRSILQAVMVGWASLQKREQIGALFHAETRPKVYMPRSGEKNYLSILQTLSSYSQWQPAFDGKNYLNQLLLSLNRYVRQGSTIFLFSDFLEFSSETEKLLAHLAKRAQIILNFIYDPFEAEPPPPYQYMLTNGQQNMLFNMQNKKNREMYQLQFQTKLDQLITFSHKHHISFKRYCTDIQRESSDEHH